VKEASGGLTFVFTDIEGSTQLLRDLQTAYGLLLRIHRRILQTCFEEQRGKEMGSEGDGLFFVFPGAELAVTAAVTAQQKLEHYAWPEGVRLRVRMGIHCGPATVSGGEYVGLTVHQASRICSAAHGGQIICSSAVVDELGPPPSESGFRDLGAYVLRGIPEPCTLWQVCAAGLEADFPPPREAVRHGGVRLTIWRRDAPRAARAKLDATPDISFRSIGERATEGDIQVEIHRASNWPGHAFRLVVRHRGTIEEEYDGLTVGGATDAATIVNGHSQLIRIDAARS